MHRLLKQLLHIFPRIDKVDPKVEDRFDPRRGIESVMDDYAAGLFLLEELAKKRPVPEEEMKAYRKKLESTTDTKVIEKVMRCIVRTFLESPTIYEIDNEFHNILMGAKWKPDILVDHIQMPKGHGIALEMPPRAFLNDADELVRDATGVIALIPDAANWHTEGASRALVVAISPLCFPVAIIPLIDGESLKSACERGVQTFEKNLTAGNRICSVPIDHELQRNLVKYTVSTLLYLMGEPDTVSELHPGLPPGKKNRNKPAFAMRPTEVVKVGSRIGEQIRRLERYADQEHAKSGHGGESGRKYRPHLRSAHFHTYRVGQGRKGVRVHLIATIVVNGVVHELDDLAKAGDVVKVS